MTSQYTKDAGAINGQLKPVSDSQGQATRHPLTLENSPEETIKRMRALPERAAKLTEIIRDLRKADAR
ncbi:MAG: hypothetical protein ABI596_06255 [Pyrinomonadaceae bacterium]